MPYRLDTHVLTVDANVIRKVDTGNPANLYSMWTVFSRHADSVEQGPRLENLSGQRETLVVDNKEKTTPTTQTLLQNIPSESRMTDLPPLSGSVESLRDEEAVDFTSVSAPLGITRPRVLRQDSCTSIRSKRGHYISSDGFEKMIIPIVNDKEPLSAPPRVAPRAKVLELEPTT
ncbi:Nitrogen regulatory protein areA, GATA-like domain [Fusarium oxysporum f. sp. vasinfectum]|nr:Nitrogen regulatory protein areA, GATA-like domain [Fusarium oxysporum f. sp. vasinfectum]